MSWQVGLLPDREQMEAELDSEMLRKADILMASFVICQDSYYLD